ncbi:MAG: MBOAT family O-acyltransferase [Dysgonomonas sp.]
MLFNSIQFAIFLILVYVLYWFAFKKNLKGQNTLLFAVSYIFYAFWDYRFLTLLFTSTIIGYFCGIQIEKVKSNKARKRWLVIGITGLLSLLFLFKYFNFFIISFSDLVALIGFNPHLTTLSIILPLGISFYTFHGLSYVLDVYNKKINPTASFIDYSIFISFFPLLIAGPIERATHLLPQIEKSRIFNYSKTIDGLKQILWGLFKKIVIADSCASLVNPIFAGQEPYYGSTYLLGAILFSIQIYADFSGYSDMAIGIARLLGFDILNNFRYPYFSRNIAEFWRRWHISLTSWFRDYLYIPLGGSRNGIYKTVRNIFIIFLISGLWHGANWTFLFWGLLNAFYILPSILWKTNRNYIDIVAKDRGMPRIKETLQIALTFSLATFSWIFFRCETLEDAFVYINNIFSSTLFTKPDLFSGNIILIILLFFIIEWIGRRDRYAIENIGIRWKTHYRWMMYYAIIIFILYFSNGDQQQFIYFQF